MKIGDYVRTDNGYIGKIISITDNRSGCWLTCECNDGIFDTNANAKSSPNIIDLIEVGDYVNGYRVIEATPNDKRKKQQITIGVDYREYGEDYLENKDIKSVVTKEMFANAEYRVESN